MGARLWRLLALLALGVIVAAAALAWGVQRELNAPYAGWDGERVDVVIRPGSSAGSMLRGLAASGVIRRPALTRAWLSWRGGSKTLQAGEYRFEEAASPLAVLARLRRGDVLLHTVSVPEGLTRLEIADRFVEAGFGPRDELLAAFADPGPLRDLDGEASDLEGYLFPETYSFPRGTGAQAIAETMLRRFREVTGSWFAEQAQAAGLTPRNAVILASMIEEETSLPEERPTISRVFHNRLARGMKMQCDPTVLYAIQRAGLPLRKLTYADLKIDSPWNTYHVGGLPLGPIANPGEASLRAAVEPAEGGELYFVAAPGGGHRFTNDLASHRRAVAEWRRYSRSSR